VIHIHFQISDQNATIEAKIPIFNFNFPFWEITLNDFHTLSQRGQYSRVGDEESILDFDTTPRHERWFPPTGFEHDATDPFKREIHPAFIMGEPRIHKNGIVDVEFGEDVTLVEPVNLYGCTLGDGVFVGPFVEIQRRVSIGARTRVQSHAFICELVTIGEDCFISHGAMFINDPFRIGGPARGDQTQWKETTIGNRVSIGTNATIMPVNICDDVVIGAGSVVTKDITKPGTYAGNPARKM